MPSIATASGELCTASLSYFFLTGFLVELRSTISRRRSKSRAE
jgi:hypothetical protein